jgi:S-methylmethionine-dependent homocysteine/selenocysteine methylase
LEITYSLICAAAKGDTKAQEQILNYYDDYINSLATVVIENEYGEKIKFIDEDLKSQLQLKLLEATMKWRLLKR